MYDFHVHSSFSADCEVDMEDMILKAIEMGLHEICFTDHIDYDYQDPSIVFEFDIAQYQQKTAMLQEKYINRIKVLRGIEIGIQPHIISKCNDLVTEGAFDFVISSIHTSDRKDLHIGDFFKGKTPKQSYELYYAELFQCSKSFERFNVIGHMDLLKRYSHHVEIQDIRNFFPIIEEIFKSLIYSGKGIEVNTSGFRYPLMDFIPGKDVLQFYKSLGGEIITTGSDAHSLSHLGLKFKDLYGLLKEIGFKYICSFEKMEPTFIKI